MSPPPLAPAGTFGRLARQLIEAELPDLPAAACDDTVGFVCRRVGRMPGPLRFGVIVLTAGAGVAVRVAGEERTTDYLRRTELPLLGELARLIRSLGFTYVWATWPATSPTGAPAVEPRDRSECT